jgi:hypothetical protein
MQKWAKMLLEAAWRAKKDWTCPTKYKRYMEDAGFVDVTEVQYKWPINPWPTDGLEKAKGGWCLMNLILGLESMSMAPMTRYLGMSEEEVREFLNSVQKEVKNQNIHAYIPV